MNIQKKKSFEALGLRWRWYVRRVNNAWLLVITSKSVTLECSYTGAYDDVKAVVGQYRKVMESCSSLWEFEQTLHRYAGDNLTVNHQGF